MRWAFIENVKCERAMPVGGEAFQYSLRAWQMVRSFKTTNGETIYMMTYLRQLD
jgi:hypothetical protein